MQNLATFGLSANKPLSMNWASNVSIPSISPQKPMSADLQQQQQQQQQQVNYFTGAGLEPRRPISSMSQMPKSLRVEPRKPIQIDDLMSQHPRQAQTIEPYIEPRKPLKIDPFSMPSQQPMAPSIDPRKPLMMDPFSISQQPMAPSIDPRKPLMADPFSISQQPMAPSIDPRKPLMMDPFSMRPSQQPMGLSIDPRKPLMMDPFSMQPSQQPMAPSIDPRKPLIMDPFSMVPSQQPMAPSIDPRKPLTQNLFNLQQQLQQIQQMQQPQYPDYQQAQQTTHSGVDYFSTLTLPPPPTSETPEDMMPIVAETDPLYTQVPSLLDRIDEYIIDRPEQIHIIQQSRTASRVPEVEPVSLSSITEIEKRYTTKIGYHIKRSLKSTNEIEHEMQKLKELYEAGFLLHAEYENRLAELTVEKKYSSVNIVPHHDLGFSNSRSSSTTSKSRNIRIFVSSTFRDMSEEREILIKHVFPKLREFCKSRGVFLTAVDLRWGITEEDTNKGDTISICLKEIDRCRPYFLCMLGQRYGWAQPLDPRLPRDALLQKSFNTALDFPWITKYSDRSVTELEVRHAVLNQSDSLRARHSLFFFRDKGRERDDDPRLTKLKDEITLNASLKTINYKIPDFGSIVYDEMCRILNEDFPTTDLPTPLEKERMAHLAFQESRARIYIGRQYYFDTINAHLAKQNSGPIVIIGSSGSGKSALVCNWTMQYRDAHPTELVISHYIGSTAASADLGRMLQRILQEINHHYDLGKEKEIPQQFKELSEAFPKWLAEASRRGGLVLVLDALNQLDPQRHNALDLAWLPLHLPLDVKLVVSTLPGRTQEVLQSRGWTTLMVEPLSNAERQTLIQEYLALFGKKLTDSQLDVIVNAPQCENPLFLRTLLEEIRVFGVFEKLDERIAHYLTSSTPPQLFELVFTRLETDFESIPGAPAGFVGDTLALLWVSRRGLTESELVEILNLSYSVWSPFYLAVSEAVVSKAGYLSFFHDYMRQAVESRYLKSINNYHKYRQILVNYFSTEKYKDEQRKCEEVPYILENDGQWPELCAFISKLENFTILFERENKFDLYRYWRQVGSANHKPADLLINAISESQTRNTIQMWSLVANFLQDIGDYDPAEKCSRKSLAMAESAKSNDMDLAQAYQGLAYILRLKGDFKGAAPLYERALQMNEAQPNPNLKDLAQSINSLAILYRMQGKYDKAEPLYERALKIRRSIFGDVHEDIAQSFNSLGCLNQDMGRYAISEGYFQQAIQQREQLLGSNHPDVAMSINNLGGLYLDWSKYSQAEPAYLRAMHIYKNVFGDVHPSVAKTINSLAGLYQEQGKYKQAEEMYKSCIAMKRKLLGNNHPEVALTLNDFAVLYARQDKFTEAKIYYEEALKIRESVFGQRHPDYAQSLKNLGSLHQDMKEFNDALVLFKKALEIVTEIFGQKHQDVASACVTLAGCYNLMQRYDDAAPLYDRALRILQELLGNDHADVALALNDMAVLYFKKGDLLRSEELYLRALKTYENVFGSSHPHTGEAVVNIAQFYHSTKKFDKAKKFYEQGIQIFEVHHGPEHTKTLKLKQSYQLILQNS